MAVAQQQIQESQKQIQEEEIPIQVLQKFDNDEQLVRRFLANGYSLEQLEQSQISHPTQTDPVVTVKDSNGQSKVAGFWL